MPNNPRQAIKQTLQSAMNELEKAGQKLIGLSELYEPGHPEHYQALCMLIESCADLKGAVEMFSSTI